MEPISIAAVTAVAMKYVLPAIRELGEQVLDKTTDATSDTVVGFGRRVLHLLLDRPARGDQPVLQAAVQRRVAIVAKDPGQSKATDQLEGAVEDLLMADAGLLAAVEELLERAPVEVVHHTDRSVHVGRDNRGAIMTGDSATISHRSS
jgi:hypothetical protein